MSIYRKVQAVERVFKQLEKEVATFQKATGMHCLSGCGLCCKKPDITASPVEFLPLAYHLYINGRAFEFYDRLEDKTIDLCLLYAPLEGRIHGGLCSQYRHRGLICRLFGFTAARNKHGEPQLVTCRTIKESQPEEYQKGLVRVGSGDVALMRDYYFRLHSIDPDMGRLLPINEAIRTALEKVMSYYAYRKPRKSA